MTIQFSHPHTASTLKGHKRKGWRQGGVLLPREEKINSTRGSNNIIQLYFTLRPVTVGSEVVTPIV